MMSKYLLLYQRRFQRHWKKMMSLIITTLQIGEDQVEIGAGNIIYKQETKYKERLMYIFQPIQELAKSL